MAATTLITNNKSRRKPAVLARVTVDGTTKSGQPASRSHHPVWFPAQPSTENAFRRSSNSSDLVQEARIFHNPDGSSNGFASSGNVNTPAGLFGGFSSSMSSSRDVQEGDSFDRARGGRYPGVGGGGGGDGNVSRGLLFEVREFYGPTRVVIELVSGGTGMGTGGGGSGSGGAMTSGGKVLGRCEARIAEALVGREGGGSIKTPQPDSVQTPDAGFGRGKGKRGRRASVFVFHLKIARERKGGGGVGHWGEMGWPVLLLMFRVSRLSDRIVVYLHFGQIEGSEVG